MPLTEAEVIASGAVTITAGLELLDSTNVLIQDISDQLLSGSVSRRANDRIHGRASFQISENYQWQNQRLRPYIEITDVASGDGYRWDLGVYLPETPARIVGQTPAIYSVEAYDKLIILDNPIGSTYRIAAGTGYISAIESALTSAGVLQQAINQTSTKTLPTDRIWEIDQKNTWLLVVNDLLKAIGYVPIYTDRSGYFRSEPWTAPSGRPQVWTYNANSPTVTIVSELSGYVDYFDIPNKWVFVRDNPDPAETLPTEGAGIYTVLNQSSGSSSIDARGRTITEIVFLDVADHASLVLAGDAIVEKDNQPISVLELKSRPNPLHWHESAVKVTSSELGISAKTFSEQAWSLPLDGSPMYHELVGVTA